MGQRAVAGPRQAYPRGHHSHGGRHREGICIKRLPLDQQWDDERIKGIKGSPNNWKLDAGIEPQLVEIEDRRNPELDPSHESRAGTRVGEKRSIYLSRKDFNSHGYTDGCTGCRDLASGKQRAGSFISPHNAACRKRMENAIKTADSDRWARYLLRRGQEVEAEEEGLVRE